MTEEQLNQQLAQFFGEMTRHFDERFNVLEAKVDGKADADRVYTGLDNIKDQLTEDREERAAISLQQDRQTEWIRQLAENIGTRLQPEP